MSLKLKLFIFKAKSFIIIQMKLFNLILFLKLKFFERNIFLKRKLNTQNPKKSLIFQENKFQIFLKQFLLRKNETWF